MATIDDGIVGSRLRRAAGRLARLARRTGFAFAADRIAVLLLGVGVGSAIGWAFASQSVRTPAAAAPQRPAAAPVAATVRLDCPQPYSPHLLQTLAAGQQPTVGVFGDSFGVGVGAALDQLLKRDFHVLQFSKESTGFTRYGSLNLEDQLKTQLAAQPIDVAVIDYGANDTQGIYDGAHAYPLLSDSWKRAYGARMDRFVNLLRQNGAMVYWVGLPVMRKPDYDRQITDMEAFYEQRMTALGVPYLGVRDLSTDSAGAFDEYLPIGKNGAPMPARANDGIHMTFQGYEAISAPVVARIKDYVARAKVAAMVDVAPAAPAPVAGHAT